MQGSLTLLMKLLRRIIKNNKEDCPLPFVEPQPAHFALFLKSLPEDLEAYYRQIGFEPSKQSILFRRFMLEQTGTFLELPTRERLEAVECKSWLDQYQRDLLLQVKKSA